METRLTYRRPKERHGSFLALLFPGLMVAGMLWFVNSGDRQEPRSMDEAADVAGVRAVEDVALTAPAGDGEPASPGPRPPGAAPPSAGTVPEEALPAPAAPFTPATAARLPPLRLATASGEAQRDWPGNEPAAHRYRTLELDVAGLDGIQPGQRISVALFDNLKIDAEVRRVEKDLNGMKSVTARIDGMGPMPGYAIFISDGERVQARLNPLRDGRRYAITYSPRHASHVALDIDTVRTPHLSCGVGIPGEDCDCAGLPPAGADDKLLARMQNDAALAATKRLGLPRAGAADEGLEVPTTADEANDNGTTPALTINPLSNSAGTNIDLLIVYTPAARDWAINNATSIKHLIAHAMAMAQLTFDNSDTQVNLRLVRTEEVAYQQTGNLREELRHLTYPAGHQENPDGHLDEVFLMRNQAGADLVAMISTSSNFGGVAWLLTNPLGNPARGYSVNNTLYTLDSNVLVHEIGHNMGCMHSRWQNQNPAGSSGGLHEYSTGWRWQGTDGESYCSTMTYREGSTELPLFSNPDIFYLGSPTGTYNTGHPATAEFAPADNARTIREIAWVVSGYREEKPFVPDPIRLVRPLGGEFFGMESLERIEWESDDVLTVRIEYSIDGGDTWNTIASNAPAGLGHYDWLVPSTTTNNALVRVSVAYAPQYFDESAYAFTITQPPAGEWAELGGIGTQLAHDGHFLDDQNGWVISSGWNSGTNQSTGVVWRTSDGGQSWQSIHSETDLSHRQVFFLNQNVGILAEPRATSSGFTTTIRRTEDGGATWTTISSTPGTYVDQMTFVSETTGFAVGSRYFGANLAHRGAIWRTTNGGQSWSKIETQRPVNAVWFIDENRGWAGGVAGEVWQTVDGGNTWELMGESAELTITSIYFHDENLGWAAGRGSRIARTTDGGETWTLMASGIFPREGIYRDAFKAIRFANAHAGWAVGEDGNIFASTDGGLTWSPQASDTTQTLQYLHIFNADSAFIAGFGGTLLKYASYPRSLNVTRPAGGEIYRSGTTLTARWESEYVYGNVQIDLSADDGATWLTLVPAAPVVAGEHPWVAPQISSNQCRIRVTSLTNPEVSAVSPEPFTIQPALDLTDPDGGESWRAGSTQTIRWTTNLVTTLRFEYSLNNGASWNLIASGVSSGFKSQSWTLPHAETTQALVRATDELNPSNSDVSEAPFTIFVPGLTLTSPVGGESWPMNSVQTITWDDDQAGSLSISYRTDDSQTWQVIAANVPASNLQHNWTLPNTPSTQARIRIAAAGAQDISPAVFRIEPPGQNTELLRTLRLSSIGNRTTLSGDHAFIGDAGPSSGGIRIVDISNPASATLMGTLNAGGPGYGSALLGGNHLLLANGAAGLAVIDVADRSSPFLVTKYNTPGEALDVALIGHHALVADNDGGVRVIDVSNPASPQEAGSFIGTAGARRVIRHGQHAFVAEFRAFYVDPPQTGQGGVRVLDLENPASPQSVQFFPSTGGIVDLAVHGTRLYALEWTEEFVFKVRMFDISNPAAPVALSSYTHPEAPFAIAADARFIHLLETSGRVSIIDVLDASEPAEIGFSFVANPALNGGIAVRDDILFVTALHQGLHVIRNDAWLIAPPARPWIVSPPVAASVARSEFRHRLNAILAGGAAGSVTFTAQNLPLGLSLDDATGEITGTIARAGVYEVTVTAHGPGGTRSEQLTITVHEPTEVLAWLAGHHEDGRADPPPGLNSITHIAAGATHSLARSADGTVFAWGSNAHGETAVPPALAPASAIAAGDGFSLALLMDGTVNGWGDDSLGQISPPPGLDGVVAIASGSDHALALQWDGRVIAWGDNQQGQSSVPPEVAAIGATAIAAGDHQSLAILADGSVIAWGADDAGQATVPQFNSAAVGIAGGARHSLVLLSSGKIIPFGANNRRQLDAPQGLRFSWIAAGGDTTFAIDEDGRIHAWGAGDDGQTSPPLPPGPAVAIAGGATHGLALAAVPSSVVPGESWTLRNPLPTPHTITGFAEFKGALYATGFGGTILRRSSAGLWTAAESGTTVSLRAIAASTGALVAVGDLGTIRHSTDGLNWQAAASGMNSNLHGIAQASGVFVAVGANNAILRSTNGINWSVSRPAIPGDFFDVTHNGSQFVLVGAGGVIAASGDGSQWNAVQSPVNALLTSVAGQNGNTVITGASGALFYRPAGGNVSAVNSGTTSHLWAAAAADGQYLVAGDNGLLLQSAEGIKWAATDSGLGRSLMAVSLGTAKVRINLLGGDAGVLASSSGVTNWAMEGSEVRSMRHALLAGPGGIHAAGVGGQLLFSPDGVGWQVQNGPFAGTCRALTHFNNRYIAGGDGGELAVSIEGVEWSPVEDAGITQTIRAFASIGSRLVAVGDGGSIHSSSNGVDWGARASSTSATLHAVTHGTNRFVAVGAQGTAVVSPNGISWTAHAAGTSASLFGVAHGNNTFIAVGAGGAIFSSPDGEQWTPQPSPTSASLFDVRYGAGHFIAVGAGGVAITSPDGAQWSLRSTGYPFALNAVAHINHTYIAAGQTGVIVQSNFTTADPPRILSPPSGQTLDYAGSALLQVAAEGVNPLSYQWYRGPTGDVSQPVGSDQPDLQTGPLYEDTSFWVLVSDPVGSTGSHPAPVTVAPQRFDGWAASAGLPPDASGPLDEPFGDGFANLLRFYLRIPVPGDPSTDGHNGWRGVSKPSIITLDDGEGSATKHLRFEFTRARRIDGVTIGIENTSNLAIWHPATGNLEVIETIDEHTERVRFTESVPIGQEPFRALRLRVSMDERNP